MQWKKRLLACALSAALMTAPVLATEGEGQGPDPWAYPYLADSYALGLIDDDYPSYIQETVTEEQLAAMTETVSAKLALLGLEKRESAPDGEGLVVDRTRGGVVNALYQAAADWEIDGVEQGPEAFLTGLGVLCGDGTGSRLERLCTYQEAMVLADRLVLAVYDANDAGARGLLWKAVNGDTTLYLLGTVHVDRDNLYPMHRRVREAVDASSEVIFEVDFNDPEDLQAYAAMQVYSDGTTLKDHIPEELYTRTVADFAALGMDEATVASLKPWVLALSLNNVTMQDESTGSNAMAMDLYVNARAVNAGKTIGAAENYAFQGQIFDTLSEDYQLQMLEGSLGLLEAAMSGEETGTDPQTQAALEEQEKLMSAMMDAWKRGDPEAFAAAYDKRAILESGDELNRRLFTDRDPGMIDCAASYLARNDGKTYFMAVGAGHMTDPGGIVSGLRALGYTVEPAA